MLTTSVFSNEMSLNTSVPVDRHCTRKGTLNLFFINCNANSEADGIIKKEDFRVLQKNMFTKPTRNFKTKKPNKPMSSKCRVIIQKYEVMFL